jgi:hypothetical protein
MENRLSALVVGRDADHLRLSDADGRSTEHARGLPLKI